MHSKKLFSRRWLNQPNLGTTACSIVDCYAFGYRNIKPTNKNKKGGKHKFQYPSFEASWSLSDCSRIITLDISVYGNGQSSSGSPPTQLSRTMRKNYRNAKNKLELVKQDADRILAFLEQWKKDNFKNER